MFAANLRDLLLAAPAGESADHGPRSWLPHGREGGGGRRSLAKWSPPKRSIRTRRSDARMRPSLTCGIWLRSHSVELIAIGNGTASRETDEVVGQLIKLHPELNLTKIVVSEAGASVYSASAYASQELPNLDVSLRGAVSIARRLLDPLAKLVKIRDPKSMGVGQYQHDVSEAQALAGGARRGGRGLRECGGCRRQHRAGAPPEARVGRWGGTGGKYRGAPRRQGPIPLASRACLIDGPRLGPGAFEQCAGFHCTHPRRRQTPPTPQVCTQRRPTPWCDASLRRPNATSPPSSATPRCYLRSRPTSS